MKISILGLLFSVILTDASLNAQETRVQQEVKVTKEIELIQENGVDVLIITTNQNGVKTVEKFEGEAATKKLAELEAENPAMKDSEVKQEVSVEEINGHKKLTIKTNKDGAESVEVFEGEAADQKMKEMGIESPEPKLVPKVIKKEEIKRQKSNM